MIISSTGTRSGSNLARLVLIAVNWEIMMHLSSITDLHRSLHQSQTTNNTQIFTRQFLRHKKTNQRYASRFFSPSTSLTPFKQSVIELQRNCLTPLETSDNTALIKVLKFMTFYRRHSTMLDWIYCPERSCDKPSPCVQQEFSARPAIVREHCIAELLKHRKCGWKSNWIYVWNVTTLTTAPDSMRATITAIAKSNTDK